MTSKKKATKKATRKKASKKKATLTRAEKRKYDRLRSDGYSANVARQSVLSMREGAGLPAMSREAFWNLLSQTLELSGGDSTRQVRLLEERLKNLDLRQVLDFERHFFDLRNRLYTWDLWGVAHLVRGGCSDDSFADFRAWVISNGKGVYEAALADAQSLAALVIPEHPSNYTLEGLASVASRVYQERTGTDSSQAKHASTVRVLPQPAEPLGEAWEEHAHVLQQRFADVARALPGPLTSVPPPAAWELTETSQIWVTPGTLSTGARVSHPKHGVGEVLVCIEGAPGLEARFESGTEVVLKDELRVLPRENPGFVAATHEVSIPSCELLSEFPHSSTLRVLVEGTPVQALQGEGTLQVLVARTQGYVSSEFIDDNQVTAQRLNVRQGPGAEHPIVTQLVRGTAVRVISSGDHWLEIEIGEIGGWVFGGQIQRV